jgi:hypothetical protein
MDHPAIKDFQVTKVQQAIAAILVTKDCPAIKDFQVTKVQQEIKVLLVKKDHPAPPGKSTGTFMLFSPLLRGVPCFVSSFSAAFCL